MSHIPETKQEIQKNREDNTKDLITLALGARYKSSRRIGGRTNKGFICLGYRSKPWASNVPNENNYYYDNEFGQMRTEEEITGKPHDDYA